MSDVPTVLAVAPVHNRCKVTIELIEQLKQQICDGFVLKILVIDDGSTDNTAETIGTLFPEVAIVRADGDLWWGGALNVGFQYAVDNGLQFIYTVNNDNILQSDTILKLFSIVSRRKCIAGSVVLRPDNTVLSAGFIFSEFLRKVKNPHRDVQYESLPHGDELRSDTLSSRSTMLPTEVVSNGLSVDTTHFPHNYSDYDFFLRANKSGYDTVVARNSVVFSGESTSNFHHFVLKKSVGAILSSFFDRRYGHNLETQWFFATSHDPKILAPARFVYYIGPNIVWFAARLILSRKLLIKLLTRLGKFRDEILP